MSSYMFRRFADRVKTSIPARTKLEVVAKAVPSLYSLLMDQRSRDFYIRDTKSGIISDKVFYQNGSNILFGPLLTLGLHYELRDPSLRKYGFKAREFLDGVKPALKRYHDVEKNIDNRLFEILNEKCLEGEEKGEGVAAVDGSTDHADGERTEESEKAVPDDNNNAETPENSEEVAACNNNSEEPSKSSEKAEIKEEEEISSTSLSAEDREMMREVAERETSYMTTNNDDGDSINEKMLEILDWNWKDELVSDLIPMLSNDYFKALQMDKLLGCIQLKTRGIDLTYKSGSSSVENVALLSARVQVIEEEEEEAENSAEKDEDFGNVEEEELEMKEEDTVIDESKLSVAAQIEVLYEIKHSLSTSARVQEGGKDDIKSGEFSERIVRVGVLEGFLRGGPDGDEVQWKLCNVREPWEILPMETSYDFRPDEK